ncbi:(deoxy)nucleoside triphosphate pyrophosphohydrolase [Algoriphagus kandeliae]|uniref:8-oxo-dGTP diphosphatase n=1 Tax=Algoriphagus kandeliae TaxID=2562278 RepID=A0A4Y9QQ37_9BACT|nr:(deoxy)nucleoside triphosphate pyrophosphohydrolase [Algoriphagus kandeliae]TFV93116.1 (deoxy)nucleoside triphosphate pyrophosphohydrolase [Algoriphagus kandeliae]
MIIPVTCAIIIQDQKVLAVRRSKSMPLAGFWEFPGGKIEEGESPASCIIREIKEELGIEIKLGEILPASDHAYSQEKVIRLIPFSAIIHSGEIKLYEHDQLSWLGANELFEVTWAPADIPIVSYLKEHWISIVNGIK